jgi:hypothetical protein
VASEVGDLGSGPPLLSLLLVILQPLSSCLLIDYLDDFGFYD